jgi:glycosyltransferase involved in cell wall biosynthesis
MSRDNGGRAMIRGVSFVVPVRNGAPWIEQTLASIHAQADGRPMEIVVIDDGSEDQSLAIVEAFSRRHPVRLVNGPRRGAAAAINAGLAVARYPIVCQVDQDVCLDPGWMQSVTELFDDPTVGAVQGYYRTDRSASLCARVMGLDLEQRYAAIAGPETDHVCTGNSAYRAEALQRINGFDETMGYGYDNDVSYRLRAAGYRLKFVREATSRHRWRETISGYLSQQYGFGYGRVDLVAKHPSRARGDAVSPIGMMAHPLIVAAALASLGVSLGSMAAGYGPGRLALAAMVLILGLMVERSIAGARAMRRFGDPAALMFPIVHLARDLAWTCAIVTWTRRRLLSRRRDPSHSMTARPVTIPPFQMAPHAERRPRPALRALCLVPAHNEALNLAVVVNDIRSCHPLLDIMVVDDGSVDATPRLLESLGVRWMRFPERLGIGSAMRAGLRYAVRSGYEAVIRMDGDGQHGAEEVDRLCEPVAAGRADVVLGTRYAGSKMSRWPLTRLLHRLLAACLSALTRKPVTDPTSGFCVLGRRAMLLLAEHHPTGYPEPELRLFLSRNALNVVEVPVTARPRMNGRTSLTAGRMTAAVARVMLAMVIVPLRGRVGEAARD